MGEGVLGTKYKIEESDFVGLFGGFCLPLFSALLYQEKILMFGITVCSFVSLLRFSSEEDFHNHSCVVWDPCANFQTVSSNEKGLWGLGYLGSELVTLES